MSSETTEGVSSGGESVLVSSKLAVESDRSLSESRLAAISWTSWESTDTLGSLLAASVDIKEVEGKGDEQERA
jgi:hypothetical protein